MQSFRGTAVTLGSQNGSNADISDRGSKQRRTDRVISICLLTIIVAISAMLKFAAIEKKPFWVDEAFSMAVATGHSVQPYNTIESKSDYAETDGPTRPRTFSQYLTLDNRAPNLAGVSRAVGHLDPPLYYWLLHFWILLTGSSAIAARSFSVIFSLATIISVWSLGRLVGAGKFGCSIACLLFGLSPTMLFHSVEVKMYPLICLASATMCLSSVLLVRTRGHLGAASLWAAIGISSLFIHPYMIFILGATTLWAFVCGPAKVRYISSIVCLSGVFALVLWYKSALSGDLHNTWLSGFPSGREALSAPFMAFLYNFNVVQPLRKLSCLIFACGTVACAVLSSKKDEPHRSVLLLLMLCIFSTMFGPVFYDLVRNMHSCMIPRYSLAGLPLTFVMTGWLLARIPRWLGCSVLLSIALLWYPSWQIRLQDNVTPLRRTLQRSFTAKDAVVLLGDPCSNLQLIPYLPGDCNLIACGSRFGKVSDTRLIELLAKYERIFVCFSEENPRVSSLLEKKCVSHGVIFPAMSIAGDILLFTNKNQTNCPKPLEKSDSQRDAVIN